MKIILPKPYYSTLLCLIPITKDTVQSDKTRIIEIKIK